MTPDVGRGRSRRGPSRGRPSHEPDRWTGPGDDEGQALLAATLGLVVALVLVAMSVHVGALLVARTRVATAADHAALAAAGASTMPGRDPAAAARRVAVANGGELAACACTTIPVVVTVTLDVATPLGRLPRVATSVEATARAGLVPRARGG